MEGFVGVKEIDTKAAGDGVPGVEVELLFPPHAQSNKSDRTANKQWERGGINTIHFRLIAAGMNATPDRLDSGLEFTT
jgi:hypothetical protein